MLTLPYKNCLFYFEQILSCVLSRTAGIKGARGAAGRRVWHQVPGDECQGVHQRRRGVLHPCQRHQGQDGEEIGESRRPPLFEV